MLQTITSFRIEFHQKPYQRHRPPQVTFKQEEEECMRTEIQSMLDKRAITELVDNPEGFYSQMFLVPKKDGQQRPVINLRKTVELLTNNRALQNGGHSYAQKPAKSRRLDGEDRPEGCILHGTHGQGGPRIPPLPMERQAYQFNCLSSALWVFTKTTRPVVVI